MQVMEEELVIELCVCGYHVCKDIWEAAIREELPCERETRNIQDRYAVAVKKHSTESTNFTVLLQPRIPRKFLHREFNYGYDTWYISHTIKSQYQALSHFTKLETESQAGAQEQG